MKKSSGELADLKALLKKLDAKPTEACASIAEWRRRRESAEALIKEMELDERRGKLIEVAVVQAEWTAIAVQTRDAILSLPARVLNRLPAEWRRELQTVIEEEARLLLTGLSNQIRSKPKKRAKP